MSNAKKLLVKITAGTAAVAASASAFAVDHSTAIGDAVSGGQANYTLVVTGLIGLAAIGFGIRAVMGAMKA